MAYYKIGEGSKAHEVKAAVSSAWTAYQHAQKIVAQSSKMDAAQAAEQYGIAEIGGALPLATWITFWSDFVTAMETAAPTAIREQLGG